MDKQAINAKIFDTSTNNPLFKLCTLSMESFVSIQLQNCTISLATEQMLMSKYLFKEQALFLQVSV